MSERPAEFIAPSATIALSPDLPFAIQSQIQMALAEIDLLHRIPKRIQASVAMNSKRSEQGSYDPNSLRIEISRYAKDPLGTFIHEFGHFLDDRALHSLRGEYASRCDFDMGPLIKTCLRSKPVREIATLLKSSGHRLSRADKFYFNVAIEPQEMFARAYAQWVCSKSLNFLLQASVYRRIRTRVDAGGKLLQMQWEPSEFVDIVAHLERVFRLKGLL